MSARNCVEPLGCRVPATVEKFFFGGTLIAVLAAQIEDGVSYRVEMVLTRFHIRAAVLG